MGKNPARPTFNPSFFYPRNIFQQVMNIMIVIMITIIVLMMMIIAAAATASAAPGDTGPQ